MTHRIRATLMVDAEDPVVARVRLGNVLLDLLHGARLVDLEAVDDRCASARGRRCKPVRWQPRRR